MGWVGNTTQMLHNARAVPDAPSPLSFFFGSLGKVLPISNVIVTDFPGGLLYIFYLSKVYVLIAHSAELPVTLVCICMMGFSDYIPISFPQTKPDFL